MSTDPPSKKRGRPPLDVTDATSVHVHLRLPSKQYDALCQRAKRDDLTLPELLRRVLRRES
jgi:CxxC motif-containing protein (DUF1111 family)